MADEQNDRKDKDKDKSEDQAPKPAGAPRKTVREVVVTHLDSPPPSGKRSIHPRRRAPIVPTREERTGEKADKDKASKKTSSE